MTLRDDVVDEIAAQKEYTADDLRDADQKLEEAIQSRLHKHFKRCRLETGSDYWLFEEHGGRSVWLAFTKFDLQKELRETDTDLSYDRLVAVAAAHLEQFQESEITLAIPGMLARQLKDPFYFPINVRYPDGWGAGEWHSYQRLEELVFRYEMSPAEALDWWAVNRMNKDSAKWATKRGVGVEAIRKNVRQAKAAFENDNLGVTREEETVQVVSSDEMPSSDPHDPEKDLFYVPTEEQIEEMDDIE
ncbi:hypothetical protein [Haladaptatus sp. CMAA 1911]|uniref:hypothetical protein n=1 Tax=unclassified Haladaptatus TaxID=2622732 RepID=UPI0037547202